MDAIKILRQRAATRRDDAIKKARSDFRNASRLIDQLAETLEAETPVRTPRKGRQSNVALIAEVMPKDRTFTVQDILGLLQAEHPGRPFPMPTIRSEFSKLIDRGQFRQRRPWQRRGRGYRRAGAGFVAVASDCRLRGVRRETWPLFP